MTCIVGLVQGGKVYMGGDSSETSGWDQVPSRCEKVIKNGPFLIGGSGTGRQGNLLQHSFNPPLPTADIDKFMATAFVDALRQCLKDAGHAKKDGEQENSAGIMLVAVTGRLYAIYTDYAVCPLPEYGAIGCGGDFALGVLFATQDQPPKKRIKQALQAAVRFSAGVRAPFTIMELKPGD